MLLNCSLFSSSPSLIFFPCPSDRFIMFLGPLAPHVLILPWSNTGLRHLPLIFFVLFCYLLPFVVLVFTHLFFVLVFYLLPLPLFPAVYTPFSPVYPGCATWCFLPCNSARLRLPPSYCFVLDYTFINQIPSFLLPTLLMWLFSSVSLSQRSEFLLSRTVSLQQHWLKHSPPSNHLQQPYWLTLYSSAFSLHHTLPI